MQNSFKYFIQGCPVVCAQEIMCYLNSFINMRNYFLYFLSLSSASFLENFSVMLSISFTESPLPTPSFWRNFAASIGPSSLYSTEIPLSNNVVCRLLIFSSIQMDDLSRY